MKILRINQDPKRLIIIPRIFPNEGDTLVVKLRNENTNKSVDIDHTWGYSNNYFELDLDINYDYTLYGKYELIIYRNEVVIYRGKMMVVSDDDSIQDFKRSDFTTVNKKIKI